MGGCLGVWVGGWVGGWLWVGGCGCAVMVVLWWLCCGGCAVVVVLWWLCCGWLCCGWLWCCCYAVVPRCGAVVTTVLWWWLCGGAGQVCYPQAGVRLASGAGAGRRGRRRGPSCVTLHTQGAHRSVPGQSMAVRARTLHAKGPASAVHRAAPPLPRAIVWRPFRGALRFAPWVEVRPWALCILFGLPPCRPRLSRGPVGRFFG